MEAAATDGTNVPIYRHGSTGSSTRYQNLARYFDRTSTHQSPTSIGSTRVRSGAVEDVILALPADLEALVTTAG
jgi:hypothetical protein